MLVRMNRSPYFHDDEFFSNHGSAEEVDYALAYNKAGIAYLKEVGIKPTYAKIQAARSECELESVLKACIHDNQLAVPTLDYVQNTISDFSTLHTLGDLFIASKNVNSLWNELPLEVRENFDGNIHNFTMSINTPEFNDKLVDGYDRYLGAVSQRLDNKVELNDSTISPTIEIPTKEGVDNES